MTIIPVILSGGAGTRLWPLSRSQYPKQFLSLAAQNTMIQETLLRLENIDVASPIVICNESHRFIVADQLAQINVAYLKAEETEKSFTYLNCIRNKNKTTNTFKL